MRKIVSLSLLTSCVLGNVIHSKFSFQQHMDFGRNKGRFTPNATHLYLIDKSGKRYDISPEVRMPDFIGTTDRSGVNTFIKGSYVYTAAHTALENLYLLDRTYNVVDKEATEVSNKDAAYVRYDKFITSLLPPEATADFTKDFVPTTDLYPYAWRSGQGILMYVDDKGDRTVIQQSGVRTGGFLKWKFWYPDNGGLFHFQDYDYFSDAITKGDSGSPIMLWDKKTQKWVLGGAVSRSGQFNGGQYAPYISSLLQTLESKHTHSPTQLNGSTMTWSGNKLGGLDVGSKDLILQGGGKITLMQNVNQGGGGIYFQGNHTYTIEGDHYWKGGGISIAEGSKVIWKVKGVAGKLKHPNRPEAGYETDPDALHKIGKGTLSVEVENGGWLNLGDGVVELHTKQQAFEKIALVSGRPTLKLGEDSPNSLDPSQLFFFARGGTLDVNGNDLTFNFIKASDIGARVVNSSSKLATLTLKKEHLNILDDKIVGAGIFAYHGIIADGIKIVKTQKAQESCPFGSGLACSGYTPNHTIFDGEILNPSGELEHINGGLFLQGHPVIHAYLTAQQGNTIEKLQSFGEDVYTTPTRFEQEDWETRRFILNELRISEDNAQNNEKDKSSFTLGRNAILLANLHVSNTQVFFGGKAEIYIDGLDGENVSSSSKINFSVWKFQQSLKKGISQKDDSFYFEGNLTGSHSSNFLVCNTATNPLRFGKFMGIDRSDISLRSQKSVHYKASFDPSSSLQARYLELWGSGEDEAILDFGANLVKLSATSALQSSPSPKPSPLSSTSANTIAHLSLKGTGYSLVSGNLTIATNSSLEEVGRDHNLPASSITFSNLQTQLHLHNGTLTLTPQVRLLYEGGLNIFDLEYDKKYPLIITDSAIMDKRTADKDIIFDETFTSKMAFLPETYHKTMEIGLIFKRKASHPSPSIHSNLMFQALTQTNADKQEQFYEVAFDTLTLLAQKGEIAPMQELLSQAQDLASNLSSVATPSFALLSATSQNYAKNLKLYLESKTGAFSTQPKKLAFANHYDQRFVAINPQTDTMPNDPLFLVFESTEKNFHKQNNLWLTLSGDYAGFDSSAIYGGGLSGGYDYLFPATRDFFASVGFSLNYAYAQIQQSLLTTQSHSILTGLHSDIIYRHHEWMSHLFVGESFNSTTTNHSSLAQNFEGGFKLRNQTLDNQDFLLDLQVLYKYIIKLKSDEQNYQEVKPTIGFEYRYINLAKNTIDIFKARGMEVSLPILKAGVEYGLSNANEVHVLSLLAQYAFNVPKHRIFYVGTARYLDSSYIQTKMQNASIQAVYSGSVEVDNDIRVDYSLRAGSSLLQLGYFEVGGNLGVNWKF